MLLAVDIGNTNLAVGLFEDGRLVHTFRAETVRARTAGEYAVVLRQMLNLRGVAAEQIEAAIIASVVPPLIGPVIAHYYIVRRTRFAVEDLENVPTWNPAAVIAYVAGAAAAIMNSRNIVFDPEVTVPALLGLIVSLIVYLVAVFAGLGPKKG